MALVKAQCTNCGGTLDVDSGKEAAVCPYCDTPYIVEKAINLFQTNTTINNKLIMNNPTVNVSGYLDADTMFENWLVTRDYKLEQDFAYYYATDPRNEFLKSKHLLSSNPEEYIKLANKFLVGQRYEKYRSAEIEKAQRELARLKRIADEAHARQLEEEKEKQNDKKGLRISIVGLIVILFFMVLLGGEETFVPMAIIIGMFVVFIFVVRSMNKK